MIYVFYKIKQKIVTYVKHTTDISLGTSVTGFKSYKNKNKLS